MNVCRDDVAGIADDQAMLDGADPREQHRPSAGPGIHGLDFLGAGERSAQNA
jgi:hypothetical protein